MGIAVRRVVVSCLAVLATAACAPGSPPAQAPATTATCIPSGTAADINRALHGAGAVAELCPGAAFVLDGPVRFTDNGQRLETQGLPSGTARALLQVNGSDLTSAINGVDRSNIVIDSVRVDGRRTILGQLKGDALIEIGGRAQGQLVHNVEASDTRSWSTIHIGEGAITNQRYACRDTTITDTSITSAGTPDGNWADGISLACNDSLVRGNTIRDATDGAIVIFGSAGSTVENNTIIAATRTLLGGINMVDNEAFGGNYQGTTVRNNTIDSEGALIKVGIGMGAQVWFCGPGTNVGAVVTGNTVKGDKVGYSFPVNGVSDWTVSGNIDLAQHAGLLPGAGCGGMPSPPGGFIVQAAVNSLLQSEYTSGNLTYVLGVYESGTPPTGCAVMYVEQPIATGQSVHSCDGRFELAVTQAGTVALTQGAATLWTAPLSSNVAASLVVRADGDLVALSQSAQILWATGTGGHPGARLALQDDGNLVLYDSNDQPLWASNTSA